MVNSQFGFITPSQTIH